MQPQNIGGAIEAAFNQQMGGELHDPDRVLNLARGEFNRQAGVRRYNEVRLDNVGGHELVLFSPATAYENKASLLIIGSIHGDEPAPAWGIYDFLANATGADMHAANTSFIVVANPVGFSLGIRQNGPDGLDPNRGYTQTAKEPLSNEGKLLKVYIAANIGIAAQGFLSLHEDYEAECGYVYAYERRDTPGPRTMLLRDILRERIGIASPFEITKLCGGTSLGVTNPEGEGVIFNEHLRGPDSSLETWLHQEFGIESHVTETGGALPIELRIQANRELVRAYIHAHAL